MDNNMDKYIGKCLDDRYEIIERIGVGGMAVVYKALCHRLNRYVAIKILKDELAVDEDFRNRFHTESQAVAMLSHSNIVTVYDVSRSAGQEYIVMELIKGMTLKQYMKLRGILSWQETLHFTTQIIRALSHAHSKGIIHRDIKPHNIMILPDGSLKVTDFGIARLQTTQNTLTQETLGSVHYISPEQAKGGNVDARTDIYSLGVVMYEMLTGRLPFEGDSAVSVAIQHLSSIPLMPKEINPDIPTGLESITMRAMNPDLKQRYQTADELLEDLEAFRKDPETDFDYNEFAFVAPGIEDETMPEIAPANDPYRSRKLSGSSAKSPSGRFDVVEDDYRLRYKRTKRISSLTGVFFLLAFFVAIGIFLWNFIIKEWVVSPENTDIEVPSWIGGLYEEVKQNPAYADYNFNATYQASEEYDYGFIISQDPTPGRRVKKRDKIEINLVVSLGDEKITMPDVVNKEHRQAVIELQKLGLEVSKPYLRVTSDEVTEGYIISTEPKAGAELKEGDTVFITVSKGPDIKMQTVPDLKGRTEDAARSILEGKNLIPNPIYVDDAEPRGTVIDQSIAPDTEVQEHTQIDIIVSTGALAPTPTPSPTTGPTDAVPTDSWYEPPVVYTEPIDGGYEPPLIEE